MSVFFLLYRFSLIFISFNPTANRTTIIAHRRCLLTALHRSALPNSSHHAFPLPPCLPPCSLLFSASLPHVIFLWPVQTVTSHALPYRLSPVFTPHRHSITFLSLIHSPTLPLLSLSFSPWLSFLLWRHWTKSRPCEFHPLHSQHPLYSSPSSFCCFMWSHWCWQPWPLLSRWNLVKPTAISTELPNCTPPNYSLLSDWSRGSMLKQDYFSERELMFTFAICCRPSVWLSVVCL